MGKALGKRLQLRKEGLKKNSSLYGIRTLDLCDTGAALNQLLLLLLLLLLLSSSSLLVVVVVVSYYYLSNALFSFSHFLICKQYDIV